jgi:hypothetical protein
MKPLKKALIFISSVFLLTSCGFENKNAQGSDEFKIVAMSVQSAFLGEYNNFFDFSSHLTIGGGVINVNKKIYESRRDGEIVLEGFGRETILVGSYWGYDSKLEITHNGISIEYREQEVEETTLIEFGLVLFAIDLSLDEHHNNITLILTEPKGLSTMLTLGIEPIEK